MTNRDWFWILLGILGLILLYFLCFGAQRAAVPVAAPAPAPIAIPAPVVAPPPPVAAAPATVAPPVTASVAAEYDGGKVTLTGMVPDDATRSRIVDQAKTTYGAEQVIDKLTIDQKVSELKWFSTGAVLAPFLVKGVAGGKTTFDGKTVVLTGEVASQATKEGIGESVKTQVGRDVSVDNQLRVAAAPALKVRLDQILTGKTIEFETGSAIITPAGRKLLDETVAALQQDRGARIEVGGHTDNVGFPAENQRLSEARAISVLGYLAAKGVARERLTAKGYGQAKPIADNATAEGRARNRRIDFTVQEGGK